MRRIAQALVHPALARRHGDARLAPQPVQRDANLAPVAGADAVGDDVGEVAGVAKVKRRLGDANVRLDADEGDARSGGQRRGNGGDQHRKLRLVVGGRGQQGGDGGHGRAELGRRLRGGVDGDGEVLGVGEQLDGGGDAFWLLADALVMVLTTDGETRDLGSA